MDFQHKGMPQTATELGMHPQQPALYANTEGHPTEKMGANAIADQERRNLQQLSVLYGSHMAMRTVIDRNIFAQTKRLGQPSSMIALQDHMNRYYELDASDIYNDPRETPELDSENFGSKVLKVYGL